MTTTHRVDASAPVGAGARGSGLVLAVLCTAQALDIMNLSSVNLALPDVARDLHASPGGLSWVVSAYALAFAGLLVAAGRAADVYGHRRVLLTGLGLFGAASAGVWASGSPAVAIAARALQGAGAAVTVSAALALVGTLWREEPGRSRALGAFGAMGGVGLAVGLVAGGLLTGWASWRAMFAVDVVAVAVLAAAVLALVPADAPGRGPAGGAGRLDAAGAALVTVGLLALGLACTRVGVRAGDGAGWLAAGCAAVALTGFALRQRRAADPLVPPAVWRRPGLIGALVVAVLMYAGWVGVNYFAALLLRDVLGYSPLATGVAFLPLAVGGTVLPLLAGRLVPRLGARRLMLFGLGCYTVGLAGFALLGPGSGYWTAVLPLLAVVIVGLSQTFVSANVTALAGAGQGEQGVAGALFNTALQAGGGLGLAVLSTAAQAVGGEALSGYRAAFLTAAGLAAVALLCAAALVPGPARPAGPRGTHP